MESWSMYQHEESATPGAAGGSSQLQGPDSINPPSSETSSGSVGRTQEQGQMGGKSVGTKRLVQVYWVRADSSVIGRIVVFDGNRGQVIFHHKNQSPFEGFDYGEELALTGPSKACISADGSFAIQAHGITSGSDDESSRVIGEMHCADNVEYDTVLTGDIISTGNGRQRLATVSYAVLSDAVEASVEVNLLLPAGINQVHGMISTVQRNSVFQAKMSNALVLFERGTQSAEKLELAPASAMVPLIELWRSLIAVPFSGRRYSIMCICVEMILGDPYEDVIAGSVKLYFDKHTGEIRVEPHGEMTVPGGWAGIPQGDGTGQTIVQQGEVQLNITSPGFNVSPLQPESLRHMGLNF